MSILAEEAMTIKLDYELPPYPTMDPSYRRAPRREAHLSEADKALAIKNALRYIHPDHHAQSHNPAARPPRRHIPRHADHNRGLQHPTARGAISGSRRTPT